MDGGGSVTFERRSLGGKFTSLFETLLQMTAFEITRYEYAPIQRYCMNSRYEVAGIS
jgi:hypothetical protein